MAKISLIAAIGKNRALGKDNKLIYHIPEDLKRFKEITSGHPIIMGRKTYESIGRPLPNRTNIIITRDPNYSAEEVVIVHSLDEALQKAEGEEVFIIGGGQIYQEALKTGLITEMFITHVNHVYGADTFFPELEWRKWSQKVIMHQAVDEKNPVSFQVVRYTRQ